MLAFKMLYDLSRRMNILYYERSFQLHIHLYFIHNATFDLYQQIPFFQNPKLIK